MYTTSTRKVSQVILDNPVKELRRIVPISKLSGITKNISKDSKEFVLHVENEPDYRLTCEM